MWGFQSIKDSVQNHAAGLFRNISDRISADCDCQNISELEQNMPPRDAMKNVVTPKSIPQFTLPPLLTYESPPQSPEGSLPQEDFSKYKNLMTSRKEAGNSRFKSSNEENENLHITKSGRQIIPAKNSHHGDQESGPKGHDPRRTLERHTRSGNGSFSSLSLKSLVRGGSAKKSDVKVPSTENKIEEKSSGKGSTHNNSTSNRVSGGKRQVAEQPGMTLQHLLSTKAGFSTLTESPNTRRKESLFLRDDALNSSIFTPDTHSDQHSRAIDQVFSSGPDNSDSEESIASHSDTTNNSPILSRIRSRRLFRSSAFATRSFPESDSKHGATYSTPQGSPALRQKSATISSTKPFRAKKQGENEKHFKQRRLSLDEDSNFLCPSNSESHLLKLNTDTRRLCLSDHNVNGIRDDAVQQSAPVQPAIRVCLTYLVQHKRLNVSILEGRDFSIGHVAYLKVSLLPRHDRSHRTDTMRIETSNFTIRERLTFDSVNEDDIQHMSLKICCKEKQSRIRHADVLGECILALCDINFKTPNDIWILLKSFEEEEAPHIQLSLCYDAMLGCLTLDVVAARNVPKGSLGRQPDCFVTLTEIQPNGKIAKKQTKVVHRTQDPVFQESFLFSMCTDAQTPDQLVIVATLFAKNRVRGSVEALGSAKLGQLVDNWSGRSQWAQALANEGEPISHWHTLVVSGT